jgi:prepilin-type N-terminal cleavage/methylation domain-containing protein
MLERMYRRRAGFTLVELVVAVAIIAALAALTALYFPRYQDKEMVARGADLLQGWLLNAKQRAKRDGLPTGLWLLDFPNPANRDPKLNKGQNYCIEVHYIQQPDDFAQGLYIGAQTIGMTTNPKMATFTGVNLHNIGGTTGLQIMTGDYLEIFGSGVLRRIGNPNRQPVPVDYPVLDPAPPGAPGTLLELDPVTADLPSLPAPPAQRTDDGGNLQRRTNYRIIAQPRELAGEQKLFLPENVGIDLNPDNPINPLIDPSSGALQRRPMSRNLPTRVVNNVGRLEILFAPSGAVIGMGTGNAKILLWVRDLTRDNTVAGQLLLGGGTLITIDPRTGFIAAHPATQGAAPKNDPYEFTRDARSSGL